MKETFNNIIQKLSQKIFLPIYFFYGEEPYFIDFLASEVISRVLSPEEHDYSLHTFYGKDVKIDELFARLNMVPMFTMYNVYHIKEAQDMDARSFSKLEDYFSHPVSANILLISYKGKPSKSLIKLLDASPNIESFSSAPLKESEIIPWLVEYAKRQGFILPRETAQILVFSLGNELSMLVQALDKICISLAGKDLERRVIDMAVVEEQVGISRKYNVFELINALAKRNHSQALRIAIYFAQNEGKVKDSSVFVVLPMLTSYFEKLILFFTLKKTIADKKIIAQKMEIFPFQLWMYEEGAKNYTMTEAIGALKILRNYDMSFKGFDAIVKGEMFVDLIQKLLRL